VVGRSRSGREYKDVERRAHTTTKDSSERLIDRARREIQKFHVLSSIVDAVGCRPVEALGRFHVETEIGTLYLFIVFLDVHLIIPGIVTIGSATKRLRSRVV
jgi:hypothetical protein